MAEDQQPQPAEGVNMVDYLALIAEPRQPKNRLERLRSIVKENQTDADS